MRLFVALIAAVLGGAAPPPGVVIDHQPASTGEYIGSPSITVLSDGTYVASHDLFGPKSGMRTEGVTRVFTSRDHGATWRPIAQLHGQFWSTLFVHRGALYLIGTRGEYGDIVIRRSADGGAHWTEPTDETNGVLFRGHYHCAPDPVVESGGRVWRAFEDRDGGTKWGDWFRAMMLSAPSDADLLRASSWTKSNALARDPSWLGGDFGGWLEGNAVVTRHGRIVDFLRVDTQRGGKAAVIDISRDGRTATFDPRTGFVDFPAGASKFTIRYDQKSRRYWTLGNVIGAQFRDHRAGTVRNELALLDSKDLRHWEIRRIVLEHPDPLKHAFQYVDWQFDSSDIIAVARTASDDDAGGAHTYHDANYLTFHRIRNFRKRQP